MALLDELNQNHSNQQETLETSQPSTSHHSAVEEQLIKLTTAVNDLVALTQESNKETQQQVQDEVSNLKESILQLSDIMSESVKNFDNRLNEIDKTLMSLGDVLHAEEFTKATRELEYVIAQLNKAKTSFHKELDDHTRELRTQRDEARKTIQAVREEAIAQMRAASTSAVQTVNEELDSANTRAERTISAAERVQERLGWAAAGRMALALLPLAAVLLMGTTTIWSVVNSYQWVSSMDEALWLRIVTGTALTCVILGSGYGLWKLARWVHTALQR